MKSRHPLIAYVVLAASFAFSWTGQAQKTPIDQTQKKDDAKDAERANDSPVDLTDVQNSEPQSLDERAIRELEAIRRELGASPLRGSLLDQNDHSPQHRERIEFGSQLRELYGGAKDVPASPSGSIDFRAAHLRYLRSQCHLLADELEQLKMHEEAADLRRVGDRLPH